MIQRLDPLLIKQAQVKTPQTSQLRNQVTVSTIIALASGPGPSGVAVVRVSGPQAKSVAIQLAGALPAPRVAALRALQDPQGQKIDLGLVLWFPGPASFTGEDVVEFHVHGGKAVVVDILDACLALPDVKLAKAGEFTRRAFENGKMDLSAAEGLGDLIDAETAAQRRQALRQMEGALGVQVSKWRDDVIDALADAEGDIDFPDEDLPAGLSSRARARIDALRTTLIANLEQSQYAIRVRDGFRVAIIGAPNAGKSSLLNVLAQRDAAIVSPIAGTTRDIVEVRLVLSGVVVWIGDTAGLRATEDTIEVEGVNRALKHASDADLRIGVIASPEERSALDSIMMPDDIVVLAKCDMMKWSPDHPNDICVSSVTKTGIDALEAAIVARAKSGELQLEAAPLTRARHKEAVGETIDALSRALNAHGEAPELIAEDLRLAARSLGQIVGQVDMEDVLDRLFSQFCIGK
jgi:tRNA modification GTPase